MGRIVDRFALLAVAGELASLAGITGWPSGEALRAAQACLDAWLKDRGHSANQEEADALERIRRFITANQFTRFATGMTRYRFDMAQEPVLAQLGVHRPETKFFSAKLATSGGRSMAFAALKRKEEQLGVTVP